MKEEEMSELIDKIDSLFCLLTLLKAKSNVIQSMLYDIYLKQRTEKRGIKQFS